MLANALDTSAELWMRLQVDFDLSSLMQSQDGKRIRAIKPIQKAG
jgi:plasmid maintenance system antidote protein VapI